MQTNLLNKDMTHKLYEGSNLNHLPTIKEGSVHLICIDPPYNTGTKRKFRAGSYNDQFESSESYINFMKPIIEECYRVLAPNGSLFLIIDEHEEYNIWTLLREVFGSNNLINKIIWAYDWGIVKRNGGRQNMIRSSGLPKMLTTIFLNEKNAIE